jgi:hypothetical protein
VREVLERVVRLYDDWGKKDRAGEYRKLLAREQSRER